MQVSDLAGGNVGKPQGQDPEPDNISVDWKTAIKFYPDLESIEKRLRKFSWRLSSSYQALLLETKNFQNRSEVANQLEDGFLRQYFGNNAQIIAFAKELVLSGNKIAAKDLNDAVRVVGGSDSARVIAMVKQSHGLIQSRASQLKNLIENEGASSTNYIELIEIFGGSMVMDGFWNTHYLVTFRGARHTFKSFQDLKTWVSDTILVEI